MLCVSRLAVINLGTVWRRSASSEESDTKAKGKPPVASRDFQRSLPPHTRRGYIKWFSKLSHCKRTSRSSQGRMYTHYSRN
ncbi:hypothetical protein KR059_004860 [Drosophila kikkawai]|nr:hypothetical protein KR059_004860 [Drosophila kikkawai]